jgi:EAL domain-containing protein (putative c-di-GMP-specific phosphodiesterase class I)
VLALLAEAHLETLHRLAQLPSGTRVGVVSAEAETAHNLEHSIANAALPNVARVEAGSLEGPGLARLVRRVDVIVCSTSAAERVQGLVGPTMPVIIDDRALNQRAIQMLGTVLAQRDGEMRWMPRIQQALADGRFRLYYQPILAFSPGTIQERHGEILLRMLDEQGRIVLPGAFIPAAERYGLMLAIDQWVVSRSLEALSAVADDTGVFTINISGQSLGATEFLEFVTERIRDTEVAPDQLCFEITETAAASELGHVLRFIDTLKKVGCRFALDDFGTGLSSFSYLKTLPVDYLKIDGVFIRELASDDIDMAMVEAVNRIGHKMGLLTIAEGVESETISQKLQEIGVDYGQGYGLAKPQPLNLQQALASTRVSPRVVNTRKNF